ncbi:MAG TPA: transcription antitermination factor NusB, partial [Candidatus Sumerlaeota bacterium]|nr:transcription antitermination factor NusB [Candidatus Sumerlaeota bacterium]
MNNKPVNARSLALDLLEGAEKKSGWEHPGEYSSLSQFASGLDRRDRALAFEIAGGVQRNRLYLDYMIRPFLKSANLPEGAMKNILRLGCYQIL